MIMKSFTPLSGAKVFMIMKPVDGGAVVTGKPSGPLLRQHQVHVAELVPQIPRLDRRLVATA